MIEKTVNFLTNISATCFWIILFPIVIFSALTFKDKKFIKEYYRLLINTWKESDQL